jgi:hypothetical protein
MKIILIYQHVTKEASVLDKTDSCFDLFFLENKTLKYFSETYFFINQIFLLKLSSKTVSIND